MFDIGWPELAIVAVIALLVIGPKDLPAALQTLGQWVRYARGLGREIRQGVDELAREAELDDLRRDVQSLRASGSPRNILNEKALDAVDSDRKLRDTLADTEIRDQVSALRRDVENAASAGETDKGASEGVSEESSEAPPDSSSLPPSDTKRDT